MGLYREDDYQGIWTLKGPDLPLSRYEGARHLYQVLLNQPLSSPADNSTHSSNAIKEAFVAYKKSLTMTATLIMQRPYHSISTVNCLRKTV